MVSMVFQAHQIDGEDADYRALCDKYCETYQRPYGPHHRFLEDLNRCTVQLQTWDDDRLCILYDVPETVPADTVAEYFELQKRESEDAKSRPPILFAFECSHYPGGALVRVDNVNLFACSYCGFYWNPQTSHRMFYEALVEWAQWRHPRTRSDCSCHGAEGPDDDCGVCSGLGCTPALLRYMYTRSTTSKTDDPGDIFQ